MKKVFLGGTCARTVWRRELIKLLKIDYFNPVVKDWTEECMAEERRQREICDFCLYVITPSMKGVYSIAEVIDDSNKRPERTVFCVLEKEIPIRIDVNHNGEELPIFPNMKKKSFKYGEMKSLDQVGKMVERNGGKYFKDLKSVADYLNNN
ncbi:TPA: nucleoside 2-deoxyribosyltransferase domain-containing protein [Clostridium perfringens]